jgi:ribose 5-phosphate isomerase A
MQRETQQDTWKLLAGEAAAELVESGMVVGIGTGSTAAYMVQALSRRIQAGLLIIGAVPTSEATEQLARSLGIPLTNLNAHPELDLAIDGADEIDGHLNLIKGGGGALLREKIVASASHRFIVIADVTKQVTQLGLRAVLPVETIPFAVTPVSRRLQALGASVQIRQRSNQVFITDNGNMILDCSFPNGIADPADLQACIRCIVGVVETGLFLNMTERAIIGGPEGIKQIMAD